MGTPAMPGAKKKKKFPKIDFSFMQYYELQQEIVNDPARFKVVAFGRQSGKSWLGRRYLLEKAANEGKRCWWVAPTHPTAQDHWDALVALIEDSEFPVRKINATTKTIQFYSGGSIRIRSAEVPNNLRGATLDIIVLDEAAFMLDIVWYKILQPMITASRGEVLFLSTANGQNWFYLLFKIGRSHKYPEFNAWLMTSLDAPYQDRKTLDLIRQTIPDLVWREEYLCEFLADSGGVFAGLDKIVYRPPVTKPIAGHVYVLGVDWGLDNDYTVVSIADKYEKRQVYGERFNLIGTTEQTNRVVELILHWRPEIAYIELNGMGKPMYGILKEEFAERAEEDFGSGEDAYNEFLAFGSTKIRGVWVNNERKRQLVEGYAAAIEWGRFEVLVREDEFDQESFGAIQLSEMSTFQRKRTPSGLEVSYGAAEGYHDDTISAGYLMYMGIDPHGQKRDGNTKAAAQDVRRPVPKGLLKSPFQHRKNRPAPSGRADTRRNRSKRR